MRSIKRLVAIAILVVFTWFFLNIIVIHAFACHQP